MKKFLYLAAFAAIAICSCSKQESDVALLNKEIGFSTYEERAVTKTDPSNDDPFMVEAYYGGNKYFSAQKVSYSNNVWNLATTYFWPATVDDSHKMEFFAVRQMSGESYTVSNKTVSITSALPATADIRTCYSAATEVPDGAQAMAFTHDLAKVKFTLKAADPNLVYTVTAMKITANKKGTLTIGSSSKSWGSLSGSADYSITGYPKNPTTTASSVFGTTNIIPQSSVTVSVTYSVKTSGNVTIMSSATKTTTIDLSSNQGKVTQYNLALPSGSSEIKVSCDVTDWNSQSDQDQDWDVNVNALKFTASGAQTLKISMKGVKISGYNKGDGTLYNGSETLPQYEYSFNGTSWQDASIETASNTSSYTGISFGTSGKENLYIRGKGKQTPVILGIAGTDGWEHTTQFSFTTSVPVACSGNVMHLVNDPDNPTTLTLRNQFARLFYQCSVLTSAPTLPATTLTMGCYDSMFEGCTNLTVAPDLPAENVPYGNSTTCRFGSYHNMFKGCVSLTSVKVFATTLNRSSIGGTASFTGFLSGVTSVGTFYGVLDDQNNYWYSTYVTTEFPSNWTYSKMAVSE